MTTVAAPAVDAFLDRLLATCGGNDGVAPDDRPAVSSDDPAPVVLRLVDEAGRLCQTDPTQAETVCTAALAVAERTADPYLYAVARRRESELLRSRLSHSTAAGAERADEAIHADRLARRTLQRCGEVLQVALLDLHTGDLLRDAGRLHDALRSYTVALAHAAGQSKDARVVAARARMNRALALMALGRYQPAIGELRRALREHQALGQPVNYARVLSGVGIARMELGQYAAALRAFEDARALFRSLGLYHDAVWASYRGADCYLLQGRCAEALDILALSEPDLLQSDDATDGLAVATREVAALLQLGRDAEALAALDAAESRYPAGPPEHRAWLALQRAALELRRGAAGDALVSAHRAHDLARGTGVQRLLAEACLIEGAAALATGDRAEAHRLAARAHRLCLEAGASPLLYRSYVLLAHLAELEGQVGLAQRRYTAAIEHLEQERVGVILDYRGSFAQGRTEAYERLALLQLESGNPRGALLAAEQGKARSLTDALQGRLRLRSGRSPEVQRLEQALIALQSEYALAVGTPAGGESLPLPGFVAPAAGAADLEKRILELRRRLQAYSAGRPDSAAPRVSLPHLPSGTALIEFFFAGDQVLRFVLDSAGVHGDNLGPRLAEIERLMRALQLNLDMAAQAGAELEPRLCDQARRVLQRLSDLLLDGAGIERYRSLVFVPHGILHHLPFAALFDGERHLVERYAVSYAPSATLYAASSAWWRSSRGAPVVLAPATESCLSATQVEARTAAAILGVHPVIGSKATRRLLERRARNAPIVHLAAHAQFRPDAPLFSGVQLADGLLTTAEIFNLRLLGSLVVLSACETGLSDLGAGDELVGLARAFLYAGASTLLVSQWCVEDRATATLMRHFYQALQAGADRAGALRGAQMQLLSAPVTQAWARHPFYWAGFQLIGHGQQGLQ